MRLRLSVVDPARAGAAADLVVTAAPGTTVAEIRTDVLRAVGHAVGDLPASTAPLFAEPLFVDGTALPDDARLGAEPLLDGALLSVGRPGGPAGRLRGTGGGFLELHTVGGPDAGQVHRLAPGEHRIGRAAGAGLVIDDPDMSRVHAELAVTPTGITLRDLRSTNGTWVDGERVSDAAVPVTASTPIVVGSTTLAIRLPGTDQAASRLVDGTVQVNRSPRIGPVAQPISLHLPAPPTPRSTPRFPLVAMIVPLVVAVPLALVLRSPYALLIGFFSPLMIVGNLVSDRITGRKDHQAAVAAYEADREAVRAAASDAVRVEQVRRLTSAPDAAEILQIGSGVLQRIWERDPTDSDFLALRVGSTTLPSLVTVHDPEAARGAAPEHPLVHDVPVTVPLAELGVVGLAGARPRVAALVRSLLGQLATLHSPRHLSVVVLAHDSGTDWTWAAWLPHVAPADGLGQGAEALVGLGDHQVRRRVAELESLLDARLGERRGSGEVSGRRVVVLLDGAQGLRAVPGVARLLGLGPSVGIYLLCVDEAPGRLPVECRGTVVVGGEVATRLRVSVAEAEPLDDVVADLVKDSWVQRLARGLAPLRDATPSTGSGLPDTVRLLDVLDVDATDSSRLASQWLAVPRSTAVLLGSTAGGRFSIDLLRDGPHALVAGTTGAGKSELLQTLIAGLAVANRPDELVFVLVDYKGGAAFAECARLPHTVGLVTDLDASLTARALESLGAEIARRERLLADHGATDLQDYQLRRDRPTAGERPPPLPRLVLVVDEFRVLAEELPDFISGLVRLAAVGRSLGVHLILATQRPGGVVSADIKANVNLRVALRVQDASDSTDVVDNVAAAAISDRTPGRAVGRVGSGPPVLFQAARVGGVEADADGAERVPLSVRPLDWAALGEPAPSTSRPLGGGGPTDLSRIVDAVAATTAQLRVPRVASPWLAALPDVLTTHDVRARADDAGDVGPSGRGLVLEYGLLDDPARQRQVAAGWRLHADGALAVVGASRSGRTTTLRTMLASLAAQCEPADAWAYVLDGGGALGPLAALPHVGAVVPRDDTERAGRLLRRLLAEVSRRQELFARTSVADLTEQRERTCAATGLDGIGEALPWVVLAVDSWEILQQQWDDSEGLRCVDALHQLLRQGPAVGVLCVVAGGRGVVTGQLGTLLGHRLVLRMSDTPDAVMAGVPSRAVPTSWPPGRAVAVGGNDSQARQVQVALLDADPSGSAQHAALARLAERSALRSAARESLQAALCPFAVPPMPGTVDLGPLLAAPPRAARGGTGPSATAPLVLGLGGEGVVPVGLDPRQGRVHLVAGHPGSGRSTVLLVLAEAALHDGRPVVAVAPRASPLSGLDGRRGATVVDADSIDQLEETLSRCRAVGRPPVVLVDDVEILDGRPVEAALASLVTEVTGSASQSGPMVVAAGSTPELLSRFQGLCVQLRRPGSGLLLGPAGPTDGDVLGVRLPRREVRHPGRGVLVHRGTSTMVQVALPGRSAAYAGPERARDEEEPAHTPDGRTHRR